MNCFFKLFYLWKCLKISCRYSFSVVWPWPILNTLPFSNIITTQGHKDTVSHCSDIFSCPQQLNRWPCHWLTDSLTHWQYFYFWHYRESVGVKIWDLGNKHCQRYRLYRTADTQTLNLAINLIAKFSIFEMTQVMDIAPGSGCASGD